MPNKTVLKLLNRGILDPAACTNREPNAVPVDFYYVIPDGKLVVSGILLNTTLTNLSVPAFL